MSGEEERSRFLNDTDYAKQYLFRFIAPNDPPDAANKNYWIRLTIPNDKYFERNSDGKARSVVVMINGLAESDVRPYDEIAEDLAKEGLASILLPLPDHFCRFTPKTASEKIFSDKDPFVLNFPVEDHRDKHKEISMNLRSRIMEDETIWIDGFQQIMSDLTALFDLIRCVRSDQPETQPYREFFSPNTRISLYGYSLGGLIALSAVLKHSHLIRACFLVNSGASLEEIDASKLFENKEKWQKVQLKLLRKFRAIRNKNEQFIYAREFEQVFLGNDRKELQERLSKIFRRLLFILGANDDVFNVRDVMDIAPDEGLPIFQLPAIGHWIGAKHKPEWDLWREYLAKQISGFEQFHPPDDQYAGVLEASVNRIGDLALNENIRAKFLLLDEPPETLIPCAVSPNMWCQGDSRMVLEKGKGYCWLALQDGLDRTPLGDFVSLPEDKYGYSETEIEIINQARVETVYAKAVYQGGISSGKKIGVVAFASDKPPDRSFLQQQKADDIITSCTTTIGGFFEKQEQVNKLIKITKEKRMEEKVDGKC